MKEQGPKNIYQNLKQLEEQGLGFFNEDGEWCHQIYQDEDGKLVIFPSQEKMEELDAARDRE